MTAIVRKGDVSTGHAGFPSRPNDAGSPNVFINGIPVHRVGDHWKTHSDGDSSHDGVLAQGSPSVFANGLAVGRIGDLISDGDHCKTGSPNVFAN